MSIAVFVIVNPNNNPNPYNLLLGRALLAVNQSHNKPTYNMNMKPFVWAWTECPSRTQRKIPSDYWTLIPLPRSYWSTSLTKLWDLHPPMSFRTKWPLLYDPIHHCTNQTCVFRGSSQINWAKTKLCFTIKWVVRSVGFSVVLRIVRLHFLV